MSHIIDMTGQRFGKLLVLEMAVPDGNQPGAHWRCLCDCGNETVVQGNNLRRGHHQSCGCARKDNIERVRQEYFKSKPDCEKPKAKSESKDSTNRIRLEYIKNDPDYKKKKKAKKRMVCPYNDACFCYKKECYKCGWNPTVAKLRQEDPE